MEDIKLDNNSVKRYRFDLDKKPCDRWTDIIKENKDKLKNIEKELDEIIGKTSSSSILIWGMEKLARRGYVLFSEELICIAKETGLPLGKLTAMQLVYEMFACCTSIVSYDYKTGNPIHIRTMDWDFPFLKDLTIELEYIKNGKSIAIVTTWLGYVGVMTGMRLDKYAFSLNFRRSGKPSLWTNIVKMVTYEWPIGFMLRVMLEAVDNVDDAFSWLTKQKLIAPCYFILSGLVKSDGHIIIRNRDDVKEIISNNYYLHHQKCSLIQTNMDDCENPSSGDNILWSVERYNVAKKMLSDTSRNHDEELLWEIVNTKPVKNEETVYATFMCAKTGKYQTKIM